MTSIWSLLLNVLHFHTPLLRSNITELNRCKHPGT
uniref:Uncharacterized protein n=1 Tax=Arundo donax TaxID=35708 RepID=A0A0A9TYF1_ARUDO